jgi:hypothetical protein
MWIEKPTVQLTATAVWLGLGPSGVAMVKTVTGAHLDIVDVYGAMPNVEHPNQKEIWRSMVRHSQDDESFPVDEWAVWLLDSAPLGEPLPDRFIPNVATPKRSATTDLCNAWPNIPGYNMSNSMLSFV